jgi:hypothetical protein
MGESLSLGIGGKGACVIWACIKGKLNRYGIILARPAQTIDDAETGEEEDSRSSTVLVCAICGGRIG